MTDSMMFPNRWEKFMKDYSFVDHKEFYTNGARLISTFRVEQMVEHYFSTDNYVCRWIPVSERLPKEDGTYIVRTTSGAVTTGRFYAEMIFEPTHFRDKVYVRKAGWSRNRNVTHWMPLPEPPQEES